MTVWYPEIEFICPFCGGSAAAGQLPEPFVVHSEPPCKQFDDLEAPAYLRAVHVEFAAAPNTRLPRYLS